METNEHRSVVAGNVRAEAARLRLTQTDLANELVTSQAAVSRRLTGEVAFDVDELAHLADLFGVTVEYLVRAPVSAGAGLEVSA